MPFYTYGGCVYFNNKIDAPQEHHNKFIFNRELDFYIASLSNFMDETLTLLPELFVNKMVKNGCKTYQSCGSVIKSCIMEQKQINVTNVCGKIKGEEYLELC